MQLIVLTDRLVFGVLLLLIGLLVFGAVSLEIVEQLRDSAFVLAHNLLFTLRLGFRLADDRKVRVRQVPQVTQFGRKPILLQLSISAIGALVLIACVIRRL